MGHEAGQRCEHHSLRRHISEGRGCSRAAGMAGRDGLPLASAQCGGVWGDTYGEKRQRSRSTASLIKRVSNDLDGEETYFDRNDGEAMVLGT